MATTLNKKPTGLGIAFPTTPGGNYLARTLATTTYAKRISPTLWQHI
jgi:hypothetical protein